MEMSIKVSGETDKPMDTACFAMLKEDCMRDNGIWTNRKDLDPRHGIMEPSDMKVISKKDRKQEEEGSNLRAVLTRETFWTVDSTERVNTISLNLEKCTMVNLSITN